MDEEITCTDCGQPFTFTERDQEFYASKGFQDPKRCPACRRARKAAQGGGGNDREEYEIVCADCGETSTVPFRPRGDRPVYCRQCFRNQPR